MGTRVIRLIKPSNKTVEKHIKKQYLVDNEIHLSDLEARFYNDQEDDAGAIILFDYFSGKNTISVTESRFIR